MKYFDYAATTPTSKESLDAYVDVSQTIYGNPGSSIEAKELEERTRVDILKAMALSKSCELIFTSGGTEANNLSIKGYIKGNIKHGSHFITSKIEHASVYEVFKKLENGNKVSYIGTDSKGYIDIKEYKKALRPNTKFVSFMHVNNELGTEQPIKELYEITKEYNSDIVFMVDSVQGLGKVELLDFIPDIMTISSHKIYGPKSVGAIIMKKNLHLNKLILGGTKENGQRAGTQSLPAQVGFARSVESICKNKDSILNEVSRLKDYLENEISKLDKVYLNASSDSNVVSIFIDIDTTNKEGIKFFYDNDILISAKSADSNDLSSKSRTLKSIGLSDYKCDRTYRISLSHHKTTEDIDYLISKIKEFTLTAKNINVYKINNNEELQKHLNIREEVFVNEQRVDKNLEIDKYDTFTDKEMNIKHYNLVYDNKVIGTLRAFILDEYIKFGRIAISKEYRGQSLGILLVQKVMDILDENKKDYYLEAQLYAKDFYKQLGFKEYGQEFLDANIKHIKMLKYFENY